MKNIPILLLGYNRPNTLLQQMQRIERLDPTHVVISVDGDKILSTQERAATLRRVENWVSKSQHHIEIINQRKNLGIYDHLPATLEGFFSKFEFGAILEDDIEFTPAFFQLLMQFKNRILSGEYWSICGHNPLNTRDPNLFADRSVSIRPSNFHSVWGWASSRENVAKFLVEYRKRLEIEEIVKILDKAANSFTRDPLLRKAFVSTWTRKLLGWNNRRIESGWDTRWLFEAWRQEKFSLIPATSLAREELTQIEGQTHSHISNGSEWLDQRDFRYGFRLTKRNRSLDIALLSTWGIRRPYSWAYALRIQKQYQSLMGRN